MTKQISSRLTSEPAREQDDSEHCGGGHQHDGSRERGAGGVLHRTFDDPGALAECHNRQYGKKAGYDYFLEHCEYGLEFNDGIDRVVVGDILMTVVPLGHGLVF